MRDSSFDQMIDEITKKNKKVVLWNKYLLLIVIIGLFIKPEIIAAILLTPLVYLLDRKRKIVYLIYDIENECKDKIQEFYNAFNEIKNSNCIWHIPSSANLNTWNDKKHNAGASNLVRRKGIHITDNTPKYFKTNIRIPMIPVGKQKMYFFPERILIFDNKNVGTINYTDLSINYSNIRFIESGIVPRDSEIIDYTWKYVNKNGSPDKRFKDNVRIPIVKYSEIHFSSKSGLNEVIQLSKANKGSELEKAVSSYIL
jgi:hypothetical protein